NVIRMRIFSKAYGMAGARVGYAIGPKKLIRAFDKVRNHFGMCRISQAGALAALADTQYFDEMRDNVQTAREQINQIALANGLIALPSATNFVAIDCGRDAAFAGRVLANLVNAGIFVRMPGVAPLNRCIRVSCGTPDAMQAFAKALPDALLAAKT
ncbi:MAG: aminotransferase class I/II-fold pyridoxal phosphate-dependent enzyme, partial [Planktomarina sp.]